MAVQNPTVGRATPRPRPHANDQLRDLKASWRDADDAARARLAAAVFERIVVADDRILEEELTPYARRHGLAMALPEHMDLARPAGAGRGDPIRYRIRIIGRTEDLNAIRRLDLA